MPIVRLTQLEYFLAVARTRHFTGAARQLRIAQPSLSQQIKALEKELGAPLFNRNRGDVTLTEAGELLLPVARRMLADADRAHTEMAELLSLRRGRLRLGATPSLLTGLLPDPLARFAADHPGIRLTVREGGSPSLVEDLAAGAVDLAVLVLPLAERDPALVTVPLLAEDLVVASAAHRPAPVEGGDLRRLAEVPMVVPRDGYDLRTVTVTACRAAGFEPRFAVEGGELDAVVALVKAGMGVALLPASAVRGTGLRATRLTRPHLRRGIGLAYRSDIELPTSADAFRELLMTYLAGSSHGLL